MIIVPTAVPYVTYAVNATSLLVIIREKCQQAVFTVATCEFCESPVYSGWIKKRGGGGGGGDRQSQKNKNKPLNNGTSQENENKNSEKRRSQKNKK